MATGYGALAIYVPTVIAPLLLAEFGWSKASFALVSALGISASMCMPFVGRLADVLGVRRTALIGMIGLPLAFGAYSLMTGPLWQYVAIYVFQSVVCITTTATVYSRMPVQFIERARGLALAIVASGPAVTGAIVGARRPDQVRGVAGAAEYRLSPRELAELDAFFGRVAA